MFLITIENYFKKEGFLATEVKSDKNDEDIASSEEVIWGEIALEIHFNNYVTYED